jgi:hypothetical protein
MSDRQELTEHLGRAFEHLKALHAALAASMTDVTALRHVVLKDPKVLRRYRRALADAVRETRPLVVDAMAGYDAEIARIRSTGIWKN